MTKHKVKVRFVKDSEEEDKSEWTKRDDKRLVDACKRNGWQWEIVESEVGKSASACQLRFGQVVQHHGKSFSTVSWPDDDVLRLLQSVHLVQYDIISGQHKPSKDIEWLTVAALLNEHEWKYDAEQCKDVWNSVQRMSSNRLGGFSSVEDRIIVHHFKQSQGNTPSGFWKTLATFLKRDYRQLNGHWKALGKDVLSCPWDESDNDDAFPDCIPVRSDSTSSSDGTNNALENDLQSESNCSACDSVPFPRSLPVPLPLPLPLHVPPPAPPPLHPFEPFRPNPPPLPPPYIQHRQPPLPRQPPPPQRPPLPLTPPRPPTPPPAPRVPAPPPPLPPSGPAYTRIAKCALPPEMALEMGVSTTYSTRSAPLATLPTKECTTTRPTNSPNVLVGTQPNLVEDWDGSSETNSVFHFESEDNDIADTDLGPIDEAVLAFEPSASFVTLDSDEIAKLMDEF